MSEGNHKGVATPLRAILIAIAAFIITFIIADRSFREEYSLSLKKQEIQETLKKAHALSSHSKPFKALDLLQKIEPDILIFPDFRDEWIDLAVEIAFTTKDDKLLYSLFRFDPSIPYKNEHAALALARVLLLKGDLETYRRISKEWKKRHGKKEDDWFLLDADALLLADKPEKAIKHLQSAPKQGEIEVGRLLRLAILTQNEHPKIAWNHLSEALKKGLFLGELHYYRAQYLKGIDQDGLASIELEQAAKRDENPFYREELVNHYIEKQQLHTASTFLENQKTFSPALKEMAFFLSTIYRPLNCECVSTKAKAESLEGRWIQLIETLKNGDEFSSHQILLQFPEMASLSPHLYKGLLKIFHHKYPHLESGFSDKYPLLAKKKPTHSLFSHLESHPFPKDLLPLLDSRESYAALFLAAGWDEAALALQKENVLPSDFPRWVAYRFTEAIAKNRNLPMALTFAKNQAPSSQLLSLMGELYVKSKRKDLAIEIFKKLSSYPGSLGSKAAKNLAFLYLEEGNLEKARKILLSHEFGKTVRGKEMLAEIELKEKHSDKAEAIYQEIASSSSIAKSFLAGKAYHRKDYGKAKELLTALLKEFPHRSDLKEQLALISEKQKQLSSQLSKPL